MRFSIDRKVFARALRTAKTAADLRSDLRILKMVRIMAKTHPNGARISFVSTDLGSELTQNVVLNCSPNSIEPGSALVEIKPLFDFVDRAIGDTVELTIDNDKLSVALTSPQRSGQAHYTTRNHDAVDFPTSPAKRTRKSLMIPSADLQRLIAKVRHSASTEETRYYLNGMHLRLERRDSATAPYWLAGTTTDGHRLTRHRIECADRLDVFPEIIVPNKALTILSAALANGEDRGLTVAHTDKEVLFRSYSFSLWCKVIDGTFPDCDRVIPAPRKSGFTVDRKAIIKAVQQCIAMRQSDADSNAVAIQPSAKQIEIIHERSTGDRLSLSIPATCKYRNRFANRIGFNSKLLLATLRNLSGSDVTVQAKDYSDPIRIDDGVTTAVLMPMRL